MSNNDPVGERQGSGRRGFRPGSGVRWIVFVGFLVYAGYYWLTNRSEDPYTGQKVMIDNSLDITQEKALGLQAYNEILSQEHALPADADVSRQIRQIAQRLIAKTDVVETALAEEHHMQPQHYARGFDWDVKVIQSDQANAFCLPGGKMAVYTGLVPVAQNADAMAVVMGHEIAHALMRHGAQRMAQQHASQIIQNGASFSGMDAQQQQMLMSAMGYGALLPYARQHETQADEVGLLLAAAACYDPEQAIPLWQRMEQAGGGQRAPEFTSTHPDPGRRIESLQALMPKALEYRQRFCETAGGSATAAN